MPARPNFTDVELKGNRLKVFGVSDAGDLTDLVGIQVFVSQASKAGGGPPEVASGHVTQATSSWTAEFAKKGVGAGAVVVIGIETHSDPFTSITWAQPFEIGE
jgi:hypothetical protein